MDNGGRRRTGAVFNEVAELYDRVRPTYPGELFEDLVAITGLGQQSSVLEVGCGTGQATRSLAALGGHRHRSGARPRLGVARS
jgi:ubiquinone/menaquinone biosynthesis C-methylase UbiE